MADTTDNGVRKRTIIDIPKAEVTRILRQHVKDMGLQGCPSDIENIGVQNSVDVCVYFDQEDSANG